MSRFQGFPDPEGVFVLDTLTGEVVLVTRHGEQRRLRGSRVDAGAPAGWASVADPAPTQLPSDVVHGGRTPTWNGEVVSPVAPAPAPAQPVVAAPLASPPHASASPAPATATSPAESPAPNADTAALDLPPSLDDLEREVALTFPYPIARPWLDFLRERDPRMRCKLLVDTFTAVLKVWALIVASEYLRATEVKDAQVHKTLVRDLARPLISAWSLLLQRALPVLRDAKIPPFAPELARAYDALETKCKQRFLVSESYVDDAGQTQTRTKKLGKIQALIAYRNGLAHGFNQSAKQAQRDLDTYVPLLKEVLREARFLARYPLWHVQEGRRGASEVLGHRLMGARPAGGAESVDPAELDPKVSPLFLKNEATGDVLPLFAFFDVHEVEDGGLPGLGGDVFLFEGNTKGTVIYVSATGEHTEKASRFAHWQTLLAAKAVDVELLSADNLTLDALRAASRRVSDQAIEALVGSGKYLREASVDRADLSAHLDTFGYGQYGAFVLGGESGIGKSTLFARYVEQRREAGDAVVFYRASALPGVDVAQRLVRDLGLTGLYVEDFLATAAPLFREGPRFLLVVDAVNEFPGDVAELVRQLDGLIQQAAGHPWFRVLASVRDSAYQRLPADARFGSRGLGCYYTVDEERGGQTVKTPIVALGPVQAAHVEALYEAYRNYRQRDPEDPESPGLHRFRPTTTFAELAQDGATRALMRTPLMTRLVLEAFHRRALPDDLRADQAMHLYLEQVVVESSTPGGGFPARRRLLTRLVQEFDRAGADVLPRDALTQSSFKELRDALLNAQRDSAYVQLLELGVLLEEWEGDSCLVRFAFDKLLEYLLAELHDPKVQDADGALALAKRAVGFRNLRGALEVILARACEQGRESLLITLLDRASELEDARVKQLVRDAAATLLERLAREESPALARILAAMPLDPSPGDLEVLGQVANRLELLGEAKALDAVLATLVAEATALGSPTLLGSALLRFGRRLDVRSEWKAALETYERAAQAARDGGDEATAARVRFYAADLRGRLGDQVTAETELRQLLEVFRELGDRKSEADTLRRLGSIVDVRGAQDEYEQLTRTSLAIMEEIGDKRGIARCLNNLGNLAKKRGDTKESERLHRTSLALKQEIGDRRGSAASFANLATLAKLRGELEDSNRLYRAALAIYEELGARQDCGITLHNLSILVERQGDRAEAERLLRTALVFRRETGEPRRIQMTAYLLVALLAAGEASLDVKLCGEVQELASQIGTPAAAALGAQAALLAESRGEQATLGSMGARLDACRSARAKLSDIPDVEDGPATPYLLAARWFQGHGDPHRARDLAREALAEAGDRFWPHRAEAESLVG
jgi:tetratricopeptide (TPR) repeat protein